MEPFLLALGSAVWLGILTSISPCPLATNIAAISYIGKRIGNPRTVVISGLIYMLGRVLAYTALAVIIVASLLSIPEIALFLQKNMNKFLGPILIIAGLFLLELLRFSLRGGGIGQKLQARVDSWGLWGAGILGLFFALSFCPISAALYFGTLIPLSISHNSRIIIPTVYGIGTALPVIVFSIIVAFGTRYISSAFNKLSKVEFWARRITGIIFIAVGIYYSLIYIFGISM